MRARWLQFLQRFDFVIKHTSGKSNKATDALNRKGILLTTLQSQIIAFDHLPTLYPSDIDFKRIWETCSDHKPCKDYHIVINFFFKGDVLYVPNASLREAIIKEAHSSRLAGHFGRDKTLAAISFKFFWPNSIGMILTSSKDALFAKQLKVILKILVCTFLYLFLLLFGRIYLWILF